jgi:hypothetical protein
MGRRTGDVCWCSQHWERGFMPAGQQMPFVRGALENQPVLATPYDLPFYCTTPYWIAPFRSAPFWAEERPLRRRRCMDLLHWLWRGRFATYISRYRLN